MRMASIYRADQVGSLLRPADRPSPDGRARNRLRCAAVVLAVGMAPFCNRQRGPRHLLICRMGARVPRREPPSRQTVERAEIAEKGFLCVLRVLSVC
jgi:hypothetical protein